MSPSRIKPGKIIAVIVGRNIIPTVIRRKMIDYSKADKWLREAKAKKLNILKKYENKTEAEKFVIRIATMGLLHALSSRKPVQAASLASAQGRKICHAKPNQGRYIKR